MNTCEAVRDYPDALSRLVRIQRRLETMALVTKVVRVRKERPKVHSATRCEYCVFEVNGTVFLQLDTFGSDSRKDRGQISQSIQLDARAAQQLRAILDEAFPSTNGRTISARAITSWRSSTTFFAVPIP
jgi:hypothetical protein